MRRITTINDIERAANVAEKRYNAVLSQWKKDEIGFGEAVRCLVQFGIPLEQANQIIINA